MATCGKCGAELEDGSVFCIQCGQKAEATCVKCGAKLEDNAVFCVLCGQKVERAVAGGVSGAKLQSRKISAGIIGSMSGNAAGFRRFFLRLPKRAQLIVAGVTSLILVIALSAALSSLPSSVYKKAVRYFADSDYYEAYETIQKLKPNYKDVSMLQPYYKAHVDLWRGNYKTAWDEFKDLEPYANSGEKAKESAYWYASSLEASYQYVSSSDFSGFLGFSEMNEAISIYQELGDYRDAAERVKPVYRDYKKAVALLSGGNYDDAKALFAELNGYSDSANKIRECDYIHAGALFNEGAYSRAKAIYDSISDYGDASSKSAECDAQLAAAQERAKEQLIGKWINDEKKNTIVFIDGKNLDLRSGNSMDHCTYELEGGKLILYNMRAVEEYYFSVSDDGQTLTIRVDEDHYLAGFIAGLRYISYKKAP